jgi:uncharacterized protein YkwD
MGRKFCLLLLAASVLLWTGSPPGYCQQNDEEIAARARAARSSRAIDSENDLKPMRPMSRIEQVESLEQECLDQINRLRAAEGLTPLRLLPELLPVARDYSRRMAEERFFSHTDPDGLSVRQRVEAARIRWKMIGENLAYSNGYINPVAVTLRGWMDSPGHRRNILDPDYQHTAIGVWISADGTVYFTEIFIKL